VDQLWGWVVWTVLIGAVVAGAVGAMTPSGRRRRAARREEQRVIDARLRSTTETSPAGLRANALALTYGGIGLAAARTVAINGASFEGAAGRVTLILSVLAVLLLAVAAVLLVHNLSDHAARRQVEAEVVDTVHDSWEAESGDSHAYYVVLREPHASATRLHRLSRRTLVELAPGDRVRLMVAPRSGYVYAIERTATPPEPPGHGTRPEQRPPGPA
jgi:hypothetical protein